jgi:hypothetical protein
MERPYIHTLQKHEVYAYVHIAHKLLSICNLNRAIHIAGCNIYCLAIACAKTRLTTLHLHQARVSERTAP